MIDDITIDFCSFLKVYKYERYKKKILFNGKFIKIHIRLKKKKLSGVVALVYNQICYQTLFKV